MKLKFSISNQLTKLCKLDLPRLTDANGENPGVQPVVTNSVQCGWQFHVVRDELCWLVFAMESYSRYSIVMPYVLKPDWNEVTRDFDALWLDHMLAWFRMGGFVRTDAQIAEVVRQFNAKSVAECHRNLDMSINGHLADAKLWLEAYKRDVKPRLIDSEHAWHFCEMLNQETKRVNKQRRKSAEFVPFERFLYDNLYRYAKGLCDGPIPGTKEGDFPNPHKQGPDLRLV